ncbi:hypothetical protein NEDG_00114 [Nematocida displodere]|uniref:Uncharacterized protein n=1 Tax=Nematocida displodere TaxID=1805483 RepID=A0A177EKY0_9MICR|nr:hypothetical protein NEDG_00114 [Nematocida displodere]
MLPSENEAVTEKQLEKVLLGYLEIPYFHNNPWYLALWKRHFEAHKNASLLFLMRMKGVGLLSTWLYLRLSDYFEEKACLTCAQAVVIEGLKNKAHPLKDLEEKAATQGSKKEAHALERPSRITVLGREWIRTVHLGYSKEPLIRDGVETPFQIYKIEKYLGQRRAEVDEETEKGLNEVSLLFGSLKDQERPEKRLKQTLPKILAVPVSSYNSTLPRDLHITGDDLEHPESFASMLPHSSSFLPTPSIIHPTKHSTPHPTQHPEQDPYPELTLTPKQQPSDLDMAEDLENVSYLLPQAPTPTRTLPHTATDTLANTPNRAVDHSMIQRDRSFGTPAVNDKIVIENVLYIAKKSVGDHSLVVTRIASLGDGNITLNAKDYVLKHRDVHLPGCMEEYAHGTALKHLSDVCAPLELTVSYTDKIISLSPYFEMSSLDRAIDLMIEKQGDFPEILAAHYLNRLLEIGETLSREGYSISECSLRDFVLAIDNGEIGLRLAVYKNLLNTAAAFSAPSPLTTALLARTNPKHAKALLTPTSPVSAWRDKLTRYLAQKKERSELQNIFISQEVSIYETLD